MPTKPQPVPDHGRSQVKPVSPPPPPKKYRNDPIPRCQHCGGEFSFAEKCDCRTTRLPTCPTIASYGKDIQAPVAVRQAARRLKLDTTPDTPSPYSGNVFRAMREKNADQAMILNWAMAELVD